MYCKEEQEIDLKNMILEVSYIKGTSLKLNA